MAIDPYSPCPCGSGKRFKWCCQAIHPSVEKAFEQNAAGQHDAAIKTLEHLAAQHPDNPEPLGRLAQLLAMNDRGDDAEEALQKAFALKPDYAFGHLLQGTFRQQEGEIVGALILFRKAADLYPAEAKDQLSGLYDMIARLELDRNRPVAARVALDLSIRLTPAEDSQRQAFGFLFGDESRLPPAARREYRFRPMSDAARAELAKGAGALSAGKLGDAVKAFDAATRQAAADPAAWYNLGVARAFVGDNRGAIDALEESVGRDADEGRCAEAWALAEVLRCGLGMEQDADYVEHRYAALIAQPQPVVALINDWQRNGRLLPLRSGEEDQGVLSALVLEDVPSLVQAATGVPTLPLGAYMVIVANVLRLWHPNAETLDRILNEVQAKVGGALGETRRDVTPVQFGDVVIEAVAFPSRPSTDLEVETRMREQARRHYEEVWLNRPLKSLSGSTPLDAAGHAALKRKLAGVVRFQEECLAGHQPRPLEGRSSLPLYDFGRLRHKLGLAGASTAAEAVTAGAAPDVSAMSASDLAGLDAAALDEAALESAYRAALSLDARDLAGKFAQALVSRPANAERPDRYAYHNHLIQLALDEKDFDAALARIEAGSAADREANAGKRQNDYDLSRGRVLARRGDADGAFAAFEALIGRSPNELKYRSVATEAMLSLRQGARALALGEAALAKAREQGNRDAEGQFMELVAAARKLG